jgi:hypothetical protein
MAVTAKVRVVSKTEGLTNSYGNSKDANQETSVKLVFMPNYGDKLNEKWAKFTPQLNYEMTVLPEVAENFKVGQAFTVTFTPDEAE